jgi:plasmid stabilization system protein ParE
VIDLLWSPQSVADVEEIRAYIAVDSKLYADLTVQRIVAAVERLRMFPDSGRMVPERTSPDLREVIAGKFRIVY